MSRFEFADRSSGVELTLDADASEVRLTYAPASEPLSFTAKLHAPSPALNILCAGAAMPPAARPPAMAARLARLLPRSSSASKTLGRRLQQLLDWVPGSREDTNYTYDLTPLNLVHLAAAVSVATGRPVADIEAYLREPGADTALASHYTACIARLRPDLAATADPVARWSRRLGWYAAVRALKPKLVVETGVDKGHGALIICAALRRNAAEGHAGQYIGTDINPNAGYLLSDPYADHGKVMIGDSIASLRQLAQPIDIFINDSDHSADYEYREYQTIAPLLHTASVIIGDNAHVTDKLPRFAAETGRRFLFFREEPEAHWYAGAGIGFAFT